MRFSPEVRYLLEIKSQQSHQTMTEYLTQLILAQPARHPDIAKRMDSVIDQIRAIGVNINQIARHENAGIFEADDLKNIRAYQAMIEAEVLELREILMRPKV
jgi:hypothetical protein